MKDASPSSPSAREESKVGSFFDEFSGGWTERYKETPFRDRFEYVMNWVRDENAPQAGPAPGTKALDYGCGSGVFMAALMRLKYEVTGVDRSGQMLAQARKAMNEISQEQGETPQFTLLQNEDGRWPIQEKGCFQLALCIAVLEYVKECGPLLGHLSNALKPGGALIMNVPNRRSLSRTVERFIHRHPKLFGWNSKLSKLTANAAYLDIQQHQFTYDEIRALVEQAGMRVESHIYGSAPLPFRLVRTNRHFGANIFLLCRKPAAE